GAAARAGWPGWTRSAGSAAGSVVPPARATASARRTAGSASGSTAGRALGGRSAGPDGPGAGAVRRSSAHRVPAAEEPGADPTSDHGAAAVLALLDMHRMLGQSATNPRSDRSDPLR